MEKARDMLRFTRTKWTTVGDRAILLVWRNGVWTADFARNCDSSPVSAPVDTSARVRARTPLKSNPRAKFDGFQRDDDREFLRSDDEIDVLMQFGLL